MSSVQVSKGAVLSLSLAMPASHASTRSPSSTASSFAFSSLSTFAFSSSSIFLAAAARCSLISPTFWSICSRAAAISCCTFSCWPPVVRSSAATTWLNSAFSWSAVSGVATLTFWIALRMFMAASCSKRFEAWSSAFSISVCTRAIWLPHKGRLCAAACWSSLLHWSTVCLSAALSFAIARLMTMAASLSCSCCRMVFAAFCFSISICCLL
mmetsp:Transcript_12765/g.33724  ORF Transcript_12765/g.33724 Transcript_12765/m.33724 type:complete len:211 (+) Transcript_12765:2042-2674(+)